jgi:hypothetical protein
MKRLVLVLLPVLLIVIVVNWPGPVPVAVVPVPIVLFEPVPGWHTNLDYTTCTEYQQSMTATQRVAAGGYLLAIERRIEVSDASAGGEFASTFAADIGAACTKYYSSTPTSTVIAAATMAYMDDLSLHPAHH